MKVDSNTYLRAYFDDYTTKKVTVTNATRPIRWMTLNFFPFYQNETTKEFITLYNIPVFPPMLYTSDDKIWFNEAMKIQNDSENVLVESVNYMYELEFMCLIKIYDPVSMKWAGNGYASTRYNGLKSFINELNVGTSIIVLVNKETNHIITSNSDNIPYRKKVFIKNNNTNDYKWVIIEAQNSNFHPLSIAYNVNDVIYYNNVIFDSYVVTAKDFDVLNLKFVYFSFTPLSAIYGSLVTSIVISSVIFVTILVIFIVILCVFGVLITYPLYYVIRIMRGMRSMKLDYVIKVSSWFMEIRKMEMNLKYLLEKLINYRSFLPSSMLEKEIHNVSHKECIEIEENVHNNNNNNNNNDTNDTNDDSDDSNDGKDHNDDNSSMFDSPYDNKYNRKGRKRKKRSNDDGYDSNGSSSGSSNGSDYSSCSPSSSFDGSRSTDENKSQLSIKTVFYNRFEVGLSQHMSNIMVIKFINLSKLMSMGGGSMVVARLCQILEYIDEKWKFSKIMEFSYKKILIIFPSITRTINNAIDFKEKMCINNGDKSNGIDVKWKIFVDSGTYYQGVIGCDKIKTTTVVENFDADKVLKCAKEMEICIAHDTAMNVAIENVFLTPFSMILMNYKGVIENRKRFIPLYYVGLWKFKNISSDNEWIYVRARAEVMEKKNFVYKNILCPFVDEEYAKVKGVIKSVGGEKEEKCPKNMLKIVSMVLKLVKLVEEDNDFTFRKFEEYYDIFEFLNLKKRSS